MSSRPHSDGTWFILICAVILLVTVLVLTGCGPDKCKQAGGHQEFSHFIYVPIYNAATKTTQTHLIPQYECVIP